MRITLAILALTLFLCASVAAAPRVEQGQTLFVNETYDITGVTGWPDDDGEYWLQWCDGNDVCPLNRSGTYFLKLPGKIRSSGYPSQYNYYMDPVLFGNMSGYWLQYSGLRERGGNTVAFYVENRMRNITQRLQNGTVVNVTVLGAIDEPYEKPEPFGYILPDLYVADYVLARGDDMIVATEDRDSQVWIFGRVDGVYGFKGTYNRTVIPKTLTESWEPGSYTLIIHHPGYNGQTDIRYTDDNTFQYRSGWGIWDEKATGAPQVDIETFTRIIYKTDDRYTIYRLEIQDPDITVASVDEKYLGSAKEVFLRDDLRGGATAFIVKGYTNVANGTTITFILDPQRQTARTVKQNTYTDEVICKAQGYMCQYQVAVPFYWEDVYPGQHTLYGVTAIGGEVYSDFYVSEMPADSFRPNATIKYVQDRNPYVAPPTPEVKTVVVVETKTVQNDTFIPVEPSQDAVRSAQESVIISYAIVIMAGLVVLAGLIVSAWYVVSVVKRARVMP